MRLSAAGVRPRHLPVCRRPTLIGKSLSFLVESREDRCRRQPAGVGYPPMCLAVPGKITSIEGEQPLLRTGKIDFGGVLKEASLAYVPEAKVGDYVIVHVGFAISRLDEQEATQVFEYLRQMGDLSGLDDLSPADPAPASPGPGKQENAR